MGSSSRFLNASVVTVLLFGASAYAASTPLSVAVGETKVVSIHGVQGVMVDPPEMADVQIIGDTHVQLVGRRPGSSRISVWTADKKNSTTYALKVQGKVSAPGREERTTESRFGGKKLAQPRCSNPFNDLKNASSFEQAQAMLKNEQVKPAIEKLEAIIKAEPDAAVAYLFLGAAWAKANDQTRGAAALETFALSCDDDPRTPAVEKILQEFGRRAQR